MSGYPPPSSVVLPARPLAEGQDVNFYFFFAMLAGTYSLPMSNSIILQAE